jgi:hypothetical protein
MHTTYSFSTASLVRADCARLQAPGGPWQLSMQALKQMMKTANEFEQQHGHLPTHEDVLLTSPPGASSSSQQVSRNRDPRTRHDGHFSTVAPRRPRRVAAAVVVVGAAPVRMAATRPRWVAGGRRAHALGLDELQQPLPG